VQRKIVTVFFSDIVESTSLGEALDPEALRRVLGRYFDEVRQVLERHGGTLEKFIGDAVVALFGFPAAHEDDALRALRAAAEIRERLEVLNEDLERDFGVRIAVRTGVHTGEVVVADEGAGTGFTASGDTMNVTARLEQSARADEILIGRQTRELGGDAIVVEQTEPLLVKGKTAPLEAFRLVRVLPHAAPDGRRDDLPLVGRRRELAALRDALRRAETGRECVLATIVGGAGVGKSRLAREFLAPLDDGVQVLLGRCPSYGEGVTFLPLTDALRPVLGSDPRGRVLELLAEEERRALVAELVATATGAVDGGGSPEEIFWAVRRLLEALAARSTVLLVLEDIHWAEPTLLDLVEYVAAFSSGAPVLLLCLGRSELLDERPTWAAPRENGVLTYLPPLAEDESMALVQNVTQRTFDSDELRRILDAADGNPLFLEQLLALNAEAGRSGELVVPPTIQALLHARIDRLGTDERIVLESAAIEGREFHRETVVELLPPDSRQNVGTHLLSLARRQFIRPLRGSDPGEDAFAFSHTLVRDAAYAAMPKEVRADLHVRVADHLEARERSQPEVVGHHLAEAVRYRRELGQSAGTDTIAARGARLLAAGGRRALGSGDDRAAARLLETAADLVPSDEDVGRDLRLELGRALAGSGQLDRAQAVFSELHAAARRSRDRLLELHTELGLASLRAQTDAAMPMSELSAIGERAIPELEAEGDDRGLARSWFLIHWALFRTGRLADSIEASEQVVAYSERAGDSRERLRALGAIAMAILWGPISVGDARRRCDELLERGGGARLMDAFTARVRGGLSSMDGQFERGRADCRTAVEIYEELGHPISAIGVVMELQRIERQDGQLEAAERELRVAYERLAEIGDLGYVSWVGAALALVLAEQGEVVEAKRLARVASEDVQRDHAYAQVTARLAEATALAKEARVIDAESVALDALGLVERTDMLDLHGDVVLALADIHIAAGRSDAGARRVAEAIDLYDRKGDVVSAARARSREALLHA
jgi:class 3 adenylate cyclase/tetratricopeptide (TPR) repeat protein